MSAEKMKQSNAPKKTNPHAGHRDRMRKRFLETGLAGFSEHEMLEMLFFYVHAQKNTNEIGHALIEQFDSLKGVLDADYTDLIQVKGVGERGAVLLKLVSQLLKAYHSSETQNLSLKHVDERCGFFYDQLYTEIQEVVLLACLDDQLRLKRLLEIGRGMPDHVEIDPQLLLKSALASGCTSFMLAHNHPKGLPVASYGDVRTTKTIAELFRTVHLRLVDHIITADGRSISMLDSGSFPQIR